MVPLEETASDEYFWEARAAVLGFALFGEGGRNGNDSVLVRCGSYTVETATSVEVTAAAGAAL